MHLLEKKKLRILAIVPAFLIVFLISVSLIGCDEQYENNDPEITHGTQESETNQADAAQQTEYFGCMPAPFSYEIDSSGRVREYEHASQLKFPRIEIGDVTLDVDLVNSTSDAHTLSIRITATSHNPEPTKFSLSQLRLCRDDNNARYSFDSSSASKNLECDIPTVLCSVKAKIPTSCSAASYTVFMEAEGRSLQFHCYENPALVAKVPDEYNVTAYFIYQDRLKTTKTLTNTELRMTCGHDFSKQPDENIYLTDCAPFVLWSNDYSECVDIWNTNVTYFTTNQILNDECFIGFTADESRKVWNFGSYTYSEENRQYVSHCTLKYIPADGELYLPSLDVRRLSAPYFVLDTFCQPTPIRRLVIPDYHSFGLAPHFVSASILNLLDDDAVIEFEGSPSTIMSVAGIAEFLQTHPTVTLICKQEDEPIVEPDETETIVPPTEDTVVEPETEPEPVIPDDLFTENGLSYTEVSPGVYSVWKCESTKSVISVPSKVNGREVRYIGDSAFLGCESLVSVTLPETLLKIGVSAFEGCTSLANVALPESIMSINAQAFKGCIALKKIHLPDSLRSIGEQAFADCPALTPVDIPESVTHIGHDAFG